MTKDLIDAIQNRRSIRQFKSDPIPDATVGRILDCGRVAPSAGNVEPWHFYVVKNNQIKEQLAQCSEPWIANAPVLVVVSADYEAEGQRFGERGQGLYAIQDTAAATQNMLLAAHGYGIGSCWVGDFQEENLRQILNMPSGQSPVAIIPMGYPAQEEVGAPSNKAIDDVVTIIN